MQQIGFGTPPIPVPFSGAANQNIKTWLRQYDTNTTAMRWQDRLKAEKLPMYLSGHAHSWYANLVEDGDGYSCAGDWEELQKMLIDHFHPIDFEERMRRALNNRFIQENEDVRDYYNQKMELCNAMDYER
jgi:hypothetical protein